MKFSDEDKLSNLSLQLSPFAPFHFGGGKIHIMISFIFLVLHDQYPQKSALPQTEIMFDVSPEEAAKSTHSDLIFKLFHFLY